MVKLPPTSLAQWYKPENKRHVWLHNMFSLRREMQAIDTYAANQNPDLLKKWTNQFGEHYLKIGEMVPEWRTKLNIDALNSLQKNVENQHYSAIPDALRELTQTCNNCHRDYRSTTATLYRAPNFSNIELSSGEAYTTHMDTLIKQINQIKIASTDGMPELALESLESLESGMNLLGETCSGCHVYDPRTYPSEHIVKTTKDLKQHLQTGTAKEQAKTLGTLAVIACAQCHGTHRLSFAEREQLQNGSNWRELLQH